MGARFFFLQTRTDEATRARICIFPRITPCMLAHCCASQPTLRGRAHASTRSALRAAPLCARSWDVFEALPSLWDSKIDQLPGTIDAATTREYTKLHKRFGLDTEKHVQK